jgi:elongation factor P--(R)-beta-lysine ligase
VRDETWRPTASVASLLKRSEIVWRLRHFFNEQEFAEVHTPVIGHDTVVDLNIEPVRILAGNLDCIVATAAVDCSAELFLQTSPEFSMKRLLAAGMKAIYNIGPVFRSGERGKNHNPEFTMVEWYRVGDGLDAGISFLDQLIRTVLATPAAKVTTYQAAFIEHANCDPLAASVDELSQLGASSQLGVDANWSDDRDTWLDLLFSELVQPNLGLQTPTIVSHFPASQSALAQIAKDDPRTAERFELFYRGIELANGYHELLDTAELIERNRITVNKRKAAGKSALPIESRLTNAMQAGIAACCGCALGLDRLVMVATGANDISEVMAFPIERA